MDTHTSIIEEMSEMMEGLAVIYLSHQNAPYVDKEDCLHCRAYALIERGKVLEDCVPLDEVMEVAR